MILAYIFTAAIIAVSLTIQYNIISIAGVKPDLSFIVIIYFAYNFGSFYGEVTGFINGLMLDAISDSKLGIFAFAHMALGFLAGMFGKSILKQNILTIFLLIFSASIIKGVIVLLLCYLFDKTSISAMLTIILPESFYNGLLAPPLFFLLDKLFEDVHPMEG